MHIPHFSSYMMAGFECTYALAENGRRFDLLAASKHDAYVYEDYEMLQKLGIRTVREGFAWHEIDQGNGVYDVSRFESMLQAGKDLGIQQIWDLNHFDFPEDVNPFSEKFSQRFAEYAVRVLDVIRKYQNGALYISPINEPSFFAWMCHNGMWAPYRNGAGDRFKKQLIKAAIAAMRAIRKADTNVYFIHPDPYMYRMPLRTTKNEVEQKFCDEFNERIRFLSWDMISGSVAPELGGSPEYLDVLGINYYFYNQQNTKAIGKGKFRFTSVPLESPRRKPVRDIVLELHERYGKPMVMTETGSRGLRRPAWWKKILQEVDAIRSEGLPLYGVCSYPTLDIPLGAGFIQPCSGLWDFNQRDPTLKRIPETKTLSIIKRYLKQWN